MNLDTIKNGLTQKMGVTGLKIQQHSPEILLGAGLVGLVATIVLASKATLKANGDLPIFKASLAAVAHAEDEGKTADGAPYSHEDATKERAALYVQGAMRLVKHYGPAVSIGALSLGAILASHGIMARRQVALVAAYNLLAEGYRNYRERVKEQLGEDVDRNFHMGFTEESYSTTEIDDATGKSKKVKKTRFRKDDKPLSVYARLYDNSSTQYRGDRLMDRAFLLGQQQHANDLLMLHGFVFLNQVYDMLGLPWSPEGQLVGWVLKNPEQMKAEGRDGYIDFGLMNPINDPTREYMEGNNDTVWLDFNVDGIVFEELKKLA